MIEQLYILKKDLKDGRTAEGIRLVNELICRCVPKMKLEQIQSDTKSASASIAGCVYRANTNTVLVGSAEDGNQEFQKINPGDLLMIAGIGHQSENGFSYYLLGDQWMLGANACFDHAYNKFLGFIPEDQKHLLNDEVDV